MTRLLTTTAVVLGLLAAPAGAAVADDDPTTVTPSQLTRVFDFAGSVDAVDVPARKLSFTIDDADDLPRRFAGQDAIATLPAAVRVYDEDGHRVGLDALEDAEGVVVRGRILRPSRWQRDEDGEPLITVRAKRLTVLADREDESDDAAGEDQPARGEDEAPTACGCRERR